MKLLKHIKYAALALLFIGFYSCEDGQSYSDMLRDEEKATNWYMADQKIINEAPYDSIFIVGSDAPFYRMDEDGYIYMQVVNPGDGVKAKTGDMVYFRFLRKNLKYMYAGQEVEWEGNANDMNPAFGATSFLFNDMSVTSSQTFGSGIQLPLKWLSYNCEVNMVIRSYYGFSTDQSTCQAYIYNVKYFKPEY